MRGLIDKRVRVAALILCGVGMALAAAPARAVEASASFTTYAESPSDALARYMRILANNPTDFQALIGAGRAALALDDAQSAAGFFGRAQERWPSSPLPMAGMGAALLHDGDATGSLTYFDRAVALRGSVLSFAADRGLAYDLLGLHAEAQADYRLALSGPDRDEARRRLALSLAITGNREEALATLAPLMARRDAGAVRCHALVLALSGDSDGAKRTLDTAMPGSSSAMGPFLRRLPTLSTPQRAAAVNLGIFPEWGQPNYVAASPGGDRLAEIDTLLRGSTAPPAPAAYPAPIQQTAQPPVQQPVQIASLPQTRSSSPAISYRRSQAASDRPSASSRYWVQLASGSNASALPDQFRRIKARKPDYFEGINGYMADAGERTRLLIGPFRDQSDAESFATALEGERIDAFSWTSPPGAPIRKISSE